MVNSMKKKFKLILTALLGIVLLFQYAARSVRAYETLTLNNTVTIDAKFYITEISDLPEGTVYSYSIDSTPKAYAHDGISYGSDGAVSGAPTITGTAEFVQTDFRADVMEYGFYMAKKPLTITFSDVTFTEPGIYYWKGSKTTTNEYITNNNAGFYVVVFVEDLEGSLKVVNEKVVTTSDGDNLPDTAGKLDDFKDEKKTTTHNLNIKKEVVGRQASPNDVFEFKVHIKDATPNATYSIICSDFSLGNPQSITVDGQGIGSIEFQLRHNDYIAIRDLPDNTRYTITETDPGEGYGLRTIVANGDTNGRNADLEKRQVNNDPGQGGGLKGSAESVFINEKDPASPTGISLQAKAPAAGLMLGGLLLGAAAIGRMKKSKN